MVAIANATKKLLNNQLFSTFVLQMAFEGDVLVPGIDVVVGRVFDPDHRTRNPKSRQRLMNTNMVNTCVARPAIMTSSPVVRDSRGPLF